MADAHASAPVVGGSGATSGRATGAAAAASAAESSRRGAARQAEAAPRRASLRQRSFIGTLKALDALATSGAQLSVRVTDLDSGEAVLEGDDHRVLPIAGLGVVPLLVETAAQIEFGRLDPLEIIDRGSTPPVGVAGVWQHLKAPALPVVDLAVLTAAASDAAAANA
ncbi:MAG TPA: serine hydrolase, partial [Microbacterium sp.]|nr:serine hydrolase [Microbacterium sp.]